MLKFQHRKLESVSESSSCDYSKKKRDEFIEKMVDFVTAGRFERNLLQGVLSKDNRSGRKRTRMLEEQAQQMPLKEAYRKRTFNQR